MKLHLLLLSVWLLASCTDMNEFVVEEKEQPTPTTALESIEQRIKVEYLWSAQLNPQSDRENYRLVLEAHNDRVFVAETAGRISAYTITNGELLWERLIEETISCGVAYGFGMLIFCTENADVLALDPNDGRQIWKVKLSSSVFSPPWISQENIIVQTMDGKIASLNSQDGATLWINNYTIPVLSLHGTSKPIVWKDRVISGLANGKVVALDLKNGKTAWETILTTPRGRSDLERMVDIDAGIYISGNTAYAAAYQGRIAAINLANGNILWARDMSVYHDLVVHGNKIFLTDDQSVLWALDQNNGATIWKQDKLTGRVLTAPILHSGLIVVGDFQGYLHWLNQEDGSFSGRESLELANQRALTKGAVKEQDDDIDNDFAEIEGIDISPLVVGNRVFVNDRSGVLAAYYVSP